MTPAEEIRNAVFLLRNPIRCPDLCAVVNLPFTEPLIEWLQRHELIAAEMQRYLGEEFQEGALDHDTQDALAIARAINSAA